MEKEYSAEELRLISECRLARRVYHLTNALAWASALFVAFYTTMLHLAWIGHLPLDNKIAIGAFFAGGGLSFLVSYVLIIKPKVRDNFLELREKTLEIECNHRASIDNE